MKRLASFLMMVWAASVFAQTAPSCPTQAAVLIAPADGASNVTSPVTFDWNDVPGATSYRLLASFGGGQPNAIAVTRDSQYSISVPAGPVEWWVVALAQNCPFTTSSHFRFTAAGSTASCPPNLSAPALTAPANGATNVSSPVTLAWSAVSGVSAYRVYAQVGSASGVILATTQATQITAPFPQASVTWFVEAQFANCPSTFSKASTFTVAAGSACSSTPATLIAPANNATLSAPVTFQWSAVTGAAGYKLYLGSGNTATDLSGFTTDTTLTRIVGEGAFTWRLDTVFAGCPDVRSTEFHFTVSPANTCSGSITLQSPAENAAVSSPLTASWTAVTGASAYRVWASIDGSPPVAVGRSAGPSLSLSLPSGTIEWYVEALFNQCPSIVSPHGHFTVTRGATCGAIPPPVPTAPINGAQAQSSVDFTWNATPGALLYRVWVSVNGDPFDDVGATTDTHLSANVDDGNIQWYVEALVSGCDPVVSGKANFTIPSPPRCTNGTTLLLSPPNGATSVQAPVTMVWSAVPDATEYRVFAKVDGGKTILIDRTAGTSSTKPLVPGKIEWWVDAEFDGCPATKSAHEQFTIPLAANCGSEKPQIVSPANSATNVASPVTLDWNPVSGAVGYAVFLRYNGGSPTRVGTTMLTSLTRRLPEGSFEWWVMAFFAGCPPQESAHATFATTASNCANRPPVLMAPSDGAAELTSPVHLAWSPVPRATAYKVWAAAGDDDPSLLATTNVNKLTTLLPAGTISWYVEAQFASCPATISATSSFSVRKSAPSCATPDRPIASASPQVASGTPFTIQWTPVVNATNFELLESTNPKFTGATTQVVGDISATLTRTAATQPVRYFYRVRAVSSCSDARGSYSKIVSVLVLPLARETTIDVGAPSATQQITLPGQTPPTTFTARGDKPWISVSPASGTIGPQGVTLTVTYDPSALQLGTNTGTVLITYGGAGKLAPNGVQPVVPVSVSLVTPVAPQGKNTPPPDSLIIPAVGHAPGANNSMFESDVRVANTSAQTQKYELNFTLSGTDGTQSGQSTTIDVDPGATMALDDILSNFFGVGGDGGTATGVLEIRPLTSTTSSGSTSAIPSVTTVASSRTFNSTANGTFGQFIPAIPFSQFVGQSARISLQQVAQSAAYRTNLGLVEAAGENATVLIHVYDNSGHELARIPQSLLPGEHLQLNNFLQTNGISLADGRIEVEVTSATGKVSAYASVVDNLTNDPLVVFPVTEGTVSANRYVIPGVANLQNSLANWRSDIRLFNSGTSPVTATLTYSPQPGNPGATNSVDVPIQPGEVKAMDNALQTLYGISDSTGGSILVTTPSNSALVVTARTFDQTSSGTFGQFIPAVTPADAVGNGERSLQLLQLEDSSRYRTNIGLAETSGNPATARVSLILPDSKFAINVDVPLAANQFIQLPLSGFNAGTIYNGRVTVSVTSGTGRVTAYGSVIDQVTQDPTYVPAQ